jgi:surface protein
MSTFNYPFYKLYGPGTTCSIDLVAGTTYTFDIINNSGSSHFVLETVRNNEGFYDSTSPKNLSGSLTNFSNIAYHVTDDYIAGFVLPPSVNSFDFTPAINVAKETLLFRGTGGIVLGTGSAPSPPVAASFRIDTTQTTVGSTPNNQFKLPLVSTSPLDFTIDWGDNTSDNITTWDQAQVTHTYATPGAYDITITSGVLKGWRFGGSGDRNKLMEVYDWSVWEFDTFGAFRGCNNLVSSATSVPTITTTNLITMFQRASNFNGPLNGWNVSGVEEFRQMFSEASSFNQPLNGWDMSNAINTDGMFTSASSFNQPLNNWDVSKVTEMQFMFNSASAFNQDIGNWNVSSSLNMGEMFNGATAFDQNIGSWDVRNVGNFNNFMASKTPSTFSTANLDAIYSGWSQLTGLEPILSISFGTAKYTDIGGLVGRNILTSAPNNWTIVDGGS